MGDHGVLHETDGRPREESLTSVVIVSRRRPGLLRATLQALRQHSGGREIDVIVVHEESDETVADALGPAGASVPRLSAQSDAALTPAHARNLGFAHTRGACVVFLEPGITLVAGWATTFNEALADPAVAAVQPLILDDAARVFSAGHVRSLWSDLPYMLYAGVSSSERYLERPRRLRMLSSACLAVRAAEFARVGGFDARYETGLADADLCLRLQESHATRYCLLVPQLRVVFRSVPAPQRLAPTRADRLRFIERWRAFPVADDAGHYAADTLQPAAWTVDDPARLDSATQVYTPALAPVTGARAAHPADPFACLTPEQALTRKHCFDVYIEGRREPRPGRPTVMLVAHYAPTEMFGGERSFIDVLLALEALGLNVVVTLPRRPEPGYLARVLARSVRVYLFRYPWWSGAAGAPRAAVNRFAHVCRLMQADVAYLNTVMCEAAALGAREAGIPVITHVRELITGDAWLTARIGLPVNAILDAVRARSDGIVANSRATAEMLGDHPNVVVAPNVVDVAGFDVPLRIDPARIVFGMISSNQPKKGLRDFFELAARCAALGLPATFRLVGPQNAHVQEAIAAVCPAGVPRTVDMPGYIDDPAHAIAGVNVVLSLSWFAESFGRTIAEGFAARRPAIAYDRGAVPELIEHGRSGFLVAPGDIDALVRAVSTFCQHPETIAVFGEHGRQRVLADFQPPRLQAGVAAALRRLSIPV